MTLRNKIEFTAVIVFFFGMLEWAHFCWGGGCFPFLGTWLMIWWGGAGLTALYVLWTKL